MKILRDEIWEKIHLTCLLLSGQGGSGKGQGGTHYIFETVSKTAISFMSSHKPREDLRTSLSITVWFIYFLLDVKVTKPQRITVI